MQTLCKNNPPDYYKRLDQAELKVSISDWAKDYPCIEKISLYRMKRDKDFPKDPKYVFVVDEPNLPTKSDRETEKSYTELEPSLIKYYEKTHENCSHIYHLMEDFYRIDKLPENKIPDNYQKEWLWFTMNKEFRRIEDYEMVMDVEPLVLYERDDQPCSAPNTAEPSAMEPSAAEPSAVEPSAVEPSAVEPSAVEPSAEEPSTVEPSTAEPNSVGPSTSEDIDDFPENYINSFTLEGEYWDIRYRGEKTVIRNLDRLRYIIHMLEYPNKEFYVHELIALVKGENPIVNQDYSKMDADQLEKEGLSLTELQLEHLSPEDARHFEDVINNLWGELIEAEKLGGEKHVKAQDNWDMMVKHLLQEYGVSVYSSAKGPKFRYRPKWKKDIENARTLVKNHINNAIKGLSLESSALAGYLYKHIHTGVKCVYRPDSDDPVKWVIHR